MTGIEKNLDNTQVGTLDSVYQVSLFQVRHLVTVR